MEGSDRKTMGSADGLAIYPVSLRSGAKGTTSPGALLPAPTTHSASGTIRSEAMPRRPNGYKLVALETRWHCSPRFPAREQGAIRVAEQGRGERPRNFDYLRRIDPSATVQAANHDDAPLVGAEVDLTALR